MAIVSNSWFCIDIAFGLLDLLQSEAYLIGVKAGGVEVM